MLSDVASTVSAPADPLAPDPAILDRVFAALADPTRRDILLRLDSGVATVGELAAPYPISLQAVSRHIQVLVDAGLVAREREGRVARCRLDAGPIHAAALWLARYSRYWQTQFDTLAVHLDALARETPAEPGGETR